MMHVATRISDPANFVVKNLQLTRANKVDLVCMLSTHTPYILITPLLLVPYKIGHEAADTN